MNLEQTREDLVISEIQKKAKRSEWIPARYRLVLLMCWSNFALLVMLQNLNLTIVAMVDQTAIKKTVIVSDQCFLHDDEMSLNETMQDQTLVGEFDWSPYTQGLILGAFYYGYVCSHLMGGYLASVLGGKRVLLFGMSLSAVLTLLIPTAARQGAVYLFAIRILQGLGSGVIPPVYFTMMAIWAPVEERSVMFSLLYFGSLVGSAGSVVFSGAVSSNPQLGWPWVFYGSGIFVLFFCFAWFRWGHSSPIEHPHISTEERLFIERSLNEGSTVVKKTSSKTPWGQMLRSGPFWSLLIARSCHSWGSAFDQTAIPLYLQTVFNLPIWQNGLLNGLMYFGCIFSTIAAGFAADFMRNRTQLKISTIRKLFAGISYLGSAVSFLAVTWSKCSSVPASIFLILSKFFLAISIAGDYVAMVEMGPQYAGAIAGIVLTAADMTGFLSPMVTGAITDKNVTFDQWCYVFYLTSTIVIVGGISFVLFGSSEVQPWAKDETILITQQQEVSNDYGSIDNSSR